MATKGDRLLDFVTAGWYNEVTNNMLLTTHGGSSFRYNPNISYVTLVNNTEDTYGKWEAVSIGDPVVDYETDYPVAHQRLVFELAPLDHTDPHNLVVLQQPIPPEGSGRGLVVGLTWLLLEEEPVERFIWIGPDDTLEDHRIGRIEVLRHYTYNQNIENIRGLDMGPNGLFNGINFGPSSEYGYIALCIISKFISHPIEYTFELISGFSGQQATANIYTPNGVTNELYESGVTLYDSRNIFFGLGPGDDGLCYWQDEKYYIYQANCPATS